MHRHYVSNFHVYSNKDPLFCMLLHQTMVVPPTHPDGVHPSSHCSEGGGVRYIIHGKDAVGLSVVLLGDAAKPKKQIRCKTSCTSDDFVCLCKHV